MSFPGYNAALACDLAGYTKKSSVVNQILNKFVESKNENVLKGCTFLYIKIYLESGVDSRRLGIALMDFGITPEKIIQYRREGRSAVDVAREWIDN